MSIERGGIAKVSRWLTEAQTLLAAAVGLVGLMTQLLPESLRDDLPWLRLIGLGIATVAALWLALSAHRNWRMRIPARLKDASVHDTVHIRGPRPFEDGDKLLGRDRETNLLFSMVRSLEFRWGYVSGEAGAGKTSLIRAGLIAQFKANEGDWRLIYLPRTGQRPDREIAARLSEALSLPAPDEGSYAEIGATLNTPGQPTFLVVCDQFEEFFLSARSGEMRDSVSAGLRSLWELGQVSGRVRLLFSLRKEFVDDLLSLGGTIPGLRFEDWRFPLANLALDVAEQMIEKIADAGELPVSRQLRPRLAADLAVDGRVRPVEFQIVLSRMLEQGVFELPAYSALGGARGIVSRFIAETIEPPDRKVPEIDRQVGRHLLRALCADNFAARRPVGLTAAELDSRIQHQLSAAAGGTSFGAEETRASLLRVLEAFGRARVVIEEDEDRFNLAHDYLAAPVRDATADIETAEERANRLLQHYVAQSRTDKGAVVPFNSLRQILRYSSPEERERTDARALIRRSKRRLAGVTAGTAVVLVGLVTWILPHGWNLVELPGENLRLAPLLVEDRSLVIRSFRDRFELDDLTGNSVRRIGRPGNVLVASPTGSMVVFAGSSRHVFLARRRNGFRPELVSGQPGWGEGQLDTWIVFSQDGKRGIVQFPSGDIFLLRDTGSPVRLATIDLLSPPEPLGSGWVQSAASPATAVLSASGRYLAIVDGGVRILLLDTDQRYRVAPPPVGALPLLPLPSFFDSLAFSPDGRLLVWRGSSRIYAIRTGREARPREAIQLGTFFPPILRFSPRSDQLVVVTGNRLHHWRIGDTVQRQPLIQIPLGEVGRGILLGARFDPQGHRVMGTVAGQVYIWEPDRPGTAGRPRIPEAARDTMGALRQQGWFCRDSRTALIVNRSGRLHRIGFGPSPAIDPVQLLVPGDMRLVRSEDGDEILIFGRGVVASGSCGRAGVLTLRTDQNVSNVYVGRDRRDLMLVTEDGTVRMRRSFFVWGFPLWSSKWPQLERGAE